MREELQVQRCGRSCREGVEYGASARQLGKESAASAEQGGCAVRGVIDEADCGVQAVWPKGGVSAGSAVVWLGVRLSGGERRRSGLAQWRSSTLM